MADACSNPADAEGVYLMIMQVNTGLSLVNTGHVTLILFSDWFRTSSGITTQTGHHLASTTTPHGEFEYSLSAFLTFFKNRQFLFSRILISYTTPICIALHCHKN